MILLKLTVTLNPVKVIGFIVLIFTYSYLTFVFVLRGEIQPDFLLSLSV